MSIFTPTDDLFFNLFDRQARLNHEAAGMVKELIDDFTKLDLTVEKLLEVIERGDKLREEVADTLRSAFITPFEHEDIHGLSILMNKVPGRLISSAMRMKLYKVEMTVDFKEYTEKLIDIMFAITEEVTGCVKLLKTMENASASVQRVKTLEHEGDMIQREAIAALFDGSVSSMDIIKWKEIYEQFEKGIDFCEDIALKIENMIIKHS